MEKGERIEKLERENKALKSRCYELSSGSRCCFCPLECVHRSCDFLKGCKGATMQGKEVIKNVWWKL